MATVLFDLSDKDAAAGSDSCGPALAGREKPLARMPRAEAAAQHSHVSPYDALTAALLNLYQEVCPNSFATRPACGDGISTIALAISTDSSG